MNGSDLKFAHVILCDIRRSSVLFSIFNFQISNLFSYWNRGALRSGKVWCLRFRLSRWQQGFESRCWSTLLITQFIEGE